ncbi:rhomboid family intramembrane serine protease [Soonwooa sp.]|uniref:rhomboid family intramembrane serine protease n=1 Tax=Soonwooa sp. TaxID=1938592 RepID=UPI0028A7BFBD|nr:rhomboid family intramembrane serine protease [Soonwooa sp.]
MFQNITPITKNIIIINVIVFVATLLLENYGIFVTQWLAGFFPLSPNFHSWQIITHMFMHGGYMHIAFNMLTLLSFGPVLEQVLGGKKFTILYFLAGLGGFALYNLLNFYQAYQFTNILNEQNFNIHDIYKISAYGYREGVVFSNNPIIQEYANGLYRILGTPMVGASGAIFGVVAAFSTLFPNAKLMFMFIPAPIKAKYLLPIIILISVFLGVGQFSWDNVAHFAHIGGALVGYLYIRNWKKHNNIIGG